MRFSPFLRIISTFLIASLLVATFQAHPASALDLPDKGRSIFILDVSGSTNTNSNWNKSLRPSILLKLRQPFGQPKSSSKPASPEDIYVTSITSNSVDAEFFPIVTREDADEIWGMVDRVGINPKTKRLDEIARELFSGDGIWPAQSRFLNNLPLVVPTVSACKASSIKDMDKSLFLRSKSTSDKDYVASVICETLSRIGQRINDVDNYFSNPVCGVKGSCSDIVGAISTAAASAQDLKRQSPKSSICIAIASDMLNSYPGMSRDSILNSRRIAETSPSINFAIKQGQRAAVESSVIFPRKFKVRIAVLGLGTGKNPLPREKTSMLQAYWSGFWKAAGVKTSNQATSLDEACAKWR